MSDPFILKLIKLKKNIGSKKSFLIQIFSIILDSCHLYRK